MTSPQTIALDVTDATFAAEVIERSNSVPVVVDFWAPWCGPCRVLGPTIERVAAEYGEDVVLAKLNTDENPRTAMQFRIQGIPAVKAFRNGKVVKEFTGAVPEPQVRAFFATLVPTEAERAAQQAVKQATAGDPAAEEALRQVLQRSPGNPDAVVALARLLVGRGDLDEATALLDRAPHDRRAKVLKHQIFLDRFAQSHAGEDLPGAAAANPRDPRARYRHGVWLASQGQFEAALEELMESIRIERSFADGAARQAALAVFDILGLDSPVTKEYQRRLSQLLF